MSFEFQLVLTERCNMECTYCYMRQQPVDMTFDMFMKHYEVTLPKLLSKYGKREYHAALFGGEPLLNWELLEKIVPILNDDPRCTAIIAMTNGLEFKHEYKWDFFKENNISFSLSFDGLWNKNNRPLKGGKSSYDLYTSEPLLTRFQDAKACKVMVAPDSIDSMVENYKWFVEEFDMPNPDYSLVRDDIWSEDDIRRFEIEATKLADQFISYIKQGIRTSVGFFHLYTLDLIFGNTYGKRPFGCFAGCHGGGFMPDGMVYPCARFGSHDMYPICNSATGEMFDTIDILNTPELTNPSTFKECKVCDLYKYCNAGCTYQQLAAGSNDGELSAKPVEGICKLLKILYKESMRITDVLKDNELFKKIITSSIQNIG